MPSDEIRIPPWPQPKGYLYTNIRELAFCPFSRFLAASLAVKLSFALDISFRRRGRREETVQPAGCFFLPLGRVQRWSTERKTENSRGTDVDKTTGGLISTKTYWQTKKVHSISMKAKVFRAPLKQSRVLFGVFWDSLVKDSGWPEHICGSSLSLLSFHFQPQPTSSWFLESCRYFSHPRQTLDMSWFQESNPTSWSEDLVCGTVWQHVRGSGSRWGTENTSTAVFWVSEQTGKMFLIDKDKISLNF